MDKLAARAKKFLCYLDRILENHAYLALIVLLLSSELAIYFFETPANTFWNWSSTWLSSLIFNLVLIWFYKSSRKYGFLDTCIFLATLPMVAILNIYQQFSSPDQTDQHNTLPQEKFITDVTLEIINKWYAAQLIRTENQNTGLYIYLQIPYGITLPPAEILPAITKKLKIDKSQIELTTLSENRAYIRIMPKVARKLHRSLSAAWSIPTLQQLLPRIMLKSKPGTRAI